MWIGCTHKGYQGRRPRAGKAPHAHPPGASQVAVLFLPFWLAKLRNDTSYRFPESRSGVGTARSRAAFSGVL